MIQFYLAPVFNQVSRTGGARLNQQEDDLTDVHHFAGSVGMGYFWHQEDALNVSDHAISSQSMSLFLNSIFPMLQQVQTEWVQPRHLCLACGQRHRL